MRAVKKACREEFRQKMAKKMFQKSIGFTEENFRKLEELKVRKCISLGAFINMAVAQAIRELEDKKGEN